MGTGRFSSPGAALAALALAALAAPAHAIVGLYNNTCPPGSYMMPGSLACALCGTNSFASKVPSLITGRQGAINCFDSFEDGTNIIGSGTAPWAYSSQPAMVPGWNEYAFVSGNGNFGISFAATPWANPLNQAAQGVYFAFIQAATANLTITPASRMLYNLVPGAPASISFAISMRNPPYGPSTGPVVVNFSGVEICRSPSSGPVATAPYWTFVQCTFTPAVASANLTFSYTWTGGTLAGANSISIDALTVNQVCPDGMYTETMTGSCLPCSANTLGATSCVESFESAGVAPPNFILAPTYNNWNFGACAGVSGPNPGVGVPSPYDSTPPGVGDGALFAYLTDTCSISRTVTNLQGTWAVLELAYSYDWNPGMSMTSQNALVISYNGVEVYRSSDFTMLWQTIVVQFPTTGAGILSIGAVNSLPTTFVTLVDRISLNSYCAPGTFPDPTVVSCTPCAEGSVLASPVSSAGVVTSCSLCPPGTFASGTGNKVCTPCAAGTYAPNAGSGSCSACSGASSAAGAAMCAAACPAGTYSGADGSCIACPAGTFSATAGAATIASCVACASASTFSPPGAAACAATCPVGYYAAPPSSPSACLQCWGSPMSSLVNVPTQGMVTVPSCVENFEGGSLIGALINNGWAYFQGANDYGTQFTVPHAWASPPLRATRAHTPSLSYPNLHPPLLPLEPPQNGWNFFHGGIAALGSAVGANVPWDTTSVVANSAPARNGGSYYSFLQSLPAGVNFLGHNNYTFSRILGNLGGTGAVFVSYAYSPRQGAYVPVAGASLICTLGGVTVATSTSFPAAAWSYVGPVAVTLPAGVTNPLLQFTLRNAGNSAVNIDVITVTAACAAGTYAPAGTYATCSACPAGSTSAAGASTCTCRPGFSSTGTGATLACACLPGSLLAGSGASSTCTPCAAGYYSNSPTAASCNACGANTFSVPASTNCQACPRDAAASAGSAACSCNLNFYASAGSGTPDGAAALTCAACTFGSSAAVNSTTCTCNNNFVAYGSGSTLLCQCPVPAYMISGSGSAASCELVPTATSSASATATSTATGTSSSTGTSTMTSTMTSTASLVSRHDIELLAYALHSPSFLNPYLVRPPRVRLRAPPQLLRPLRPPRPLRAPRLPRELPQLLLLPRAL